MRGAICVKYKFVEAVIVASFALCVFLPAHLMIVRIAFPPFRKLPNIGEKNTGTLPRQILKNFTKAGGFRRKK